MSDSWLGPYTINAITSRSLYQLRNDEGHILKTKQNGVNLKSLFVANNLVANKTRELRVRQPHKQHTVR